MTAAVAYVNGGNGLTEASRLYNVPLETLRRRVSGTVDMQCRPGPSTILTKVEEEKLCRYVKDMAAMGFGLIKEEVMSIAFRLVDSSGRKHPFCNGMAGRGWFDPELSIQNPQPLSYYHALCTNKQTIEDFLLNWGPFTVG